VILKQVIAAGSRIMVGEDNGGVMHIWEREEVDADYDIIL